MHYTLPKLGIEITFVEDPDNLDQWRAAVQPNTKLFFGEVLSNPKNDIFDIEGVSKVAHEAGVPLIVDNTVPTPYLIRPIEWGADIVVHSLTKFIGGHGTSIGGVDHRRRHVRLRQAAGSPTSPSPTRATTACRTGRRWATARSSSRPVCSAPRHRRGVSPFNAFLFLQGLETLSLRMERHFSNAAKVAEFLQGRDEVESVIFAGLPSAVVRARQEVRPRQGLRLDHRRSSSRVGATPARGSSRRSNCTAMSPTSATCAAW